MSRHHLIGPAELAAELAGSPRPHVLDVRPAAEFEAGHVPGAHHIPVHDIAARHMELPGQKAKRVILVGEPGKRTEAAANWLAIVGYADVAVLDGGFAAWTGAVATGPEPPRKPRRPQPRIE